MIPALIIPVLNRFDLLERCVSSIDCDVDNLLIVDNSGQYTMTNGIYSQKAWVLNMPANLGVAGSWNIGIKSFPFSPYWIFCSNDVSFCPGELSRLAACSAQDALVLSSAGWSCFSIGSEIVKTAGLFDENFHPAYYEDAEYGERLQFHKLESNVVMSDVRVDVHGDATTVNHSQQLFNRNIITNESNYKYWSTKRESSEKTTDGNYKLQRRIDNDLFS